MEVVTPDAFLLNSPLSYNSLIPSEQALVLKQAAHEYALKCLVNAKQQFSDLGFSDYSPLTYLNCLINDVSTWEGLFYAEINADLYVYNFGNSIRSILVHENTVIDDSPFWVRQLPFVRASTSLGIEIREVDMSEDAAGNHSCAHFVAHDNHFGHFLADSFGQVSLLHEVGVSRIAMFKPATPIIELVDTALDGIAFELLSLPPQGSLKLIKNLRLRIQNHIPFFVSLVHARHVLNQLEHAHSADQRAVHSLFLKRRGTGNSRVHNIIQLVGELSALGFTTFYAEGASISKLANILSKAGIIITEAGSCHLNAVFMAPEHSSIIALIPEICMTNPTPNMITSGWPYIYSHPNVILYPSKPIVTRQICDPMMSLKASYDVDKLLAMLA